MGSLKEVQFTGCLGQHGNYSFYKSVKIDGRVLSLSCFFPVRIYPDSAIFSIAEVQLLWTDRAESFVSLRLYFLPENTPEGRRRHHGEDEVIALQDKVIIRVSDLSSWLVDDSEWDWGYVLPESFTDGSTKSSSQESSHLKRAFSSDRFLKNERIRDITETGSSRILVLNYQRYVRVRTLLKRLEGSSDLNNWLSDPLVLALGGLNISPNCRILFSKEVFDYPELEDHELLCNHLAPKLKGRPRKRKRKRDRSIGSESNKSSSSTTSAGSSVAKKSLNGIYLINPCTVELEKPIISSPSSKSIGSDLSHPESPVLNLPNGNSGGDDTVVNESSGTMLGSIAEKLEPSTTTGTISTSPPRNGQFHHLKKRKGSRRNNVNNLPSPPPESLSIEPKIELESTTIKLAAIPSDDTSMGMKTTESLSFSSCLTTFVTTTTDSESRYCVSSSKSDLLEPSLIQLAEKLEKSNSLQILPIRPTVITKQEPNVYDFESNGLVPPPPKKMKTDDFPSAPSVTVSEVSVLHRKGVGINSNQRIGATGGPKGGERVTMSPVGGSDKSKLIDTGTFKHPLFFSRGNGVNTDLSNSIENIKPAHQGFISSAHAKYNSELSEKPVLSITSIETDSKRKNLFPVAWSTPSAFLPTRRIYGDPSISKTTTNHSTLTLRSMPNHAKAPPPRSNGISNLSHGFCDNVLDFSVKKQKQNSSSSQPTGLNLNVNVNVNLDPECLDLSIHKSNPYSNKQAYHSISDIPAPNVMNQLGLRLTSEVTLFPSHQQQQKQSRRQAPPVQNKVSNNGKRDLNHLHTLYNSHQFPAPQQVQQPHGNHMPTAASRQRHLPEQSKRPPEFLVGDRHHEGGHAKSNSANTYNQSNHNPHVWRPATATTPSSGSIGTTHTSSSVRRTSNRDMAAFVHASNSRPGKPKSVRSHSPVTVDRLPAVPGHFHGTSPKQNPTVNVPPSTHDHLHQQMDKVREGSGGLSFEQLTSSFGNYMMPPAIHPSACYPNIDPAYLSLFASPFQVPPSALMRLPPGTMETLQYYMQQGLSPSPHMANWPPPAAKDSRSGGQK